MSRQSHSWRPRPRSPSRTWCWRGPGHTGEQPRASTLSSPTPPERLRVVRHHFIRKYNTDSHKEQATHNLSVSVMTTSLLHNKRGSIFNTAKSPTDRKSLEMLEHLSQVLGSGTCSAPPFEDLGAGQVSVTLCLNPRKSQTRGPLALPIDNKTRPSVARFPNTQEQKGQRSKKQTPPPNVNLAPTSPSILQMKQGVEGALGRAQGRRLWTPAARGRAPQAQVPGQGQGTLPHPTPPSKTLCSYCFIYHVRFGFYDTFLLERGKAAHSSNSFVTPELYTAHR